MSRFLTYNLSQSSHAGEILQTERRRQNLSLPAIGHITGILLKYLKAIEDGNWSVLPEGNYRRYFIKSYAGVLNISADKLLAIDAASSLSHKPLTVAKPIKIANTSVHPYRLIMAGGVVAAVIVYLVSAAWLNLVPPRLQLFEPTDGQTSVSAVIKVRGQTQVGTPIAINGQAVEVSASGEFAQEVPLKPGVNIITVMAQKIYSQPTIISRQVIYWPTKSVSLIK